MAYTDISIGPPIKQSSLGHAPIAATNAHIIDTFALGETYNLSPSIFLCLSSVHIYTYLN